MISIINIMRMTVDHIGGAQVVESRWRGGVDGERGGARYGYMYNGLVGGWVLRQVCTSHDVQDVHAMTYRACIP